VASVAIEPFKALTHAYIVVTHAAPRAISSTFITESLEWIWARRTLLFVAGDTSITDIAHTSHGFHCIPRRTVDESGLLRQHALGKAHPAVAAIVRTDVSLTGQSIVSFEAVADTRLAVADASVRALCPGMQVVVVHDGPDPRRVPGAGAQGTVGAGPGGVEAVLGRMADAVAVLGAVSVARALVGAHSVLADAAVLVPGDLAPGLGFVAGRRRGSRTRLPGRVARGLHGRLTGGVKSRLKGWLTTRLS